jgi:hypothetical protein
MLRSVFLCLFLWVFGPFALLTLPHPAQAGPFHEGLRGHLLSCQAAFRGALRQEEPLAAHDRLVLCEPHLDALLSKTFSADVSYSTTQKQDLLVLVERQLRLLRELVVWVTRFPPRVDAQRPLMARLTAFENGFRAFQERLSALETWAMNASFRLGVERLANGSIEPLGGLSAFVLLDHGSQVDAAFEVATSTPLREEAGVVILPPREIDSLGVTQAWLEFKRNRSFQLKLGVFPDLEGFFTPRRWPFVSVLGRTSLVRVDGFELGAVVRHDVFGIFSPQQTKAQARLFERNLTEIVASAETARSDIDWLVKVAWRLHWYTDTSGRLPSLSVGRHRYLDTSPAPEDTRYRVSDRILLVRATFPEENVSVAAKVEGWNNILASSGGRGHYLGFEAASKWRAFDFGLEAAHVVVSCASLPPVALRNALFPGTRNTLVEAHTGYAATASLELFSKFLWNRPRVESSRGICASVPSSLVTGNTPKFEILFGFIFKVPEDAAKFD